MAQRPSEPVQLPHTDGIESALLGVGHHSVYLWSPVLRAGDSHINVLTRDLPSPAFAVFAQFAQLHFRRLPFVGIRNSRVDCRPGCHRSPSESHKLYFEPHQAVAYVVPGVLCQALKVWSIAVSTFRVPNLIQVVCDLSGQTVA